MGPNSPQQGWAAGAWLPGCPDRTRLGAGTPEGPCQHSSVMQGGWEGRCPEGKVRGGQSALHGDPAGPSVQKPVSSPVSPSRSCPLHVHALES